MKNPLHRKIYRFGGIRTFSWQCTQICWSSLTAWIHFILTMPVSLMMANSGETSCLVCRLYHSTIPRRFQQTTKCTGAEGIFWKSTNWWKTRVFNVSLCLSRCHILNHIGYVYDSIHFVSLFTLKVSFFKHMFIYASVSSLKRMFIDSFLLFCRRYNS